MPRKHRKHAAARRLEERRDQQRTPDEASDEAERDVTARDTAPRSDDGRRQESAAQNESTSSPPQPSTGRFVLLFWGIPLGLFVLIYVLRHCVGLW